MGHMCPYGPQRKIIENRLCCELCQYVYSKSDLTCVSCSGTLEIENISIENTFMSFMSV
jgi:hypothetical protein